jgi:hypothetical protein
VPWVSFERISRYAAAVEASIGSLLFGTVENCLWESSGSVTKVAPFLGYED